VLIIIKAKLTNNHIRKFVAKDKKKCQDRKILLQTMLTMTTQPTAFELNRIEYESNYPRWELARATVFQQLGELLNQNAIRLGVPLESRVKTWESVQEKFDRKSLSSPELEQLTDIIGVRAILLFRSDLTKTHELLQNNFLVIESENTGDRLNESQFGYQSQNYLVQLPKDWLAVPSLKELGNITIEIQVRTLAQHVWAAASHKLQYKHETSVPPPLLRTINRIAALLETVDLEFDRVLVEKNEYDLQARAQDAAELNVDNLAILLDEVLPARNKRTGDEPYEELLSNLKNLNVQTTERLKEIWKKHRHKFLNRKKMMYLRKRRRRIITALHKSELKVAYLEPTLV
jgi:putative GTP pyrophosphokinase